MSSSAVRILEALCKSTDSSVSVIEDMMTQPDFSWGYLLEEALRQKMLPLVALSLNNERFQGKLPKYLFIHLRESLNVNLLRLRLLRDAAVQVATGFQSEQIRFVATKGIIFESMLYGNGGGRFMNDADFMIHPRDREAASAVLLRLGYVPGLYSFANSQIEEFSRKDQLIYSLHPDHLPIGAKLTNDTLVPCVHVDVANSLTWHGSPFAIDMDEALAERDSVALPVSGAFAMPTLSPYFQFLFTALHFFREAWFERWIDWEQDVNLIKFADIVRLWDFVSPHLRSDVAMRLEVHGLRLPIAWVLEHVDRTLGTNICAECGLAGIASEEYLSSMQLDGGKTGHWRGGMRDRLYSRNRRDLLLSQ